MKKAISNKEDLIDYTVEDLPRAIHTVGELQREKEKIVLEYDSKISELQNEMAEKTEAIDLEIKKISKSIKAFVDTKKSDFISEKNKTVSLETGDLSYRKGKPSVKTKNSDKLIQSILDKNGLLKAKVAFENKLSRIFIRAKFELDKESILKNPEAAKSVTGVEIDEGEDRFYIKPYSTSTELEVG